MPASELRELGSDLRSLSHEAILNLWALLLNVLQVPQFPPPPKLPAGFHVGNV